MSNTVSASKIPHTSIRESEPIMRGFKIKPTPKPRMTRSDKWNKRDCVMRYRAFADEARAIIKTLPERFHVTFLIAMPASWSQVKRATMRGQPHRQKPDADNLLKALNDALNADDSHIWDCRVTKIWADEAGIEVREL